MGRAVYAHTRMLCEAPLPFLFVFFFFLSSCLCKIALVNEFEGSKEKKKKRESNEAVVKREIETNRLTFSRSSSLPLSLSFLAVKAQAPSSQAIECVYLLKKKNEFASHSYINCRMKAVKQFNDVASTHTHIHTHAVLCVKEKKKGTILIIIITYNSALFIFFSFFPFLLSC